MLTLRHKICKFQNMLHTLFLFFVWINLFSSLQDILTNYVNNYTINFTSPNCQAIR